jgi:hypothetical protein
VLKETSKTAKITSKELAAKRTQGIWSFIQYALASTGAKEVRHDRIRRFPPEEPYPGAWLKAGDTKHLDGYWYWGTIGVVTAHGYFVVQYPDATESNRGY